MIKHRYYSVNNEQHLQLDKNIPGNDILLQQETRDYKYMYKVHKTKQQSSIDVIKAYEYFINKTPNVNTKRKGIKTQLHYIDTITLIVSNIVNLNYRKVQVRQQANIIDIHSYNVHM